MTAIPFDTLKFSKALRNANVPQEQAEGMAQAFAEAIGDEIVTKSYLDARLSAAVSALDAKIEASKSDNLRYIVAQTFVLIGVTMALIHFGH